MNKSRPSGSMSKRVLARSSLILLLVFMDGPSIETAGSDQHASSRSLQVIRSSVRLQGGGSQSIVNHLVYPRTAQEVPAEPESGTDTQTYLLAWSGDWNAGDHSTEDLFGYPAISTGEAPGPDFLAVIAADGPHKGKVVNTVVVEGAANEPHHMQYVWEEGHHVYAGGLFSDKTFVFDVSDLPVVRLAGVNQPMDTPCGSVPDAYWVLADGTAYGTYMGGPDLAGDPRCNGGINNGFAGTPGTVVHIAPDGRTLGEFPAAGDGLDPNDSQRPRECPSNPPLARPSCANPHGIAIREDLGYMITSDYAEPRNVPTDPVDPVDPHLFRDTVRIWKFSRTAAGLDLSSPVMTKVDVMPLGAMATLPPEDVDARGFMGIMETTLTHSIMGPDGSVHKGAFASSMCGGALYYTADFTALNPMWRQVWEATAAAKTVDPAVRRTGCAGAGWTMTSPDDELLFQAVIGRNPGTDGPDDPGMPKMVYALDISALVDFPADQWYPENPLVCSVDTEREAIYGGEEPTCPRLTASNVLRIDDPSSGGPHWGAVDNLNLTPEGKVRRIATSNYFVARSGTDGDHRVCLVDVSPAGELHLDQNFRDEIVDEPCVDFDRSTWPHGTHGPAKPHAVLFVSKAT